jgi:Terminase large subunit, T4likevirus-type, N-terminal
MLTADLAADLALALDPAALARRAGVDPDDWQAEVLRSVAPRILLNCSRQSGKSTTVATLATWQSLYDPGLILLLSPGERQSKELFRKCLDAWKALGRPVPAESENTLTLELANGARVVALPGNESTVRGYSGAKLLIVDEASRVPDPLYRATRPMLAVSGGRLIALSTPFGKRGWWHDAWTGDEEWQRYQISASMCPRISPAFLAEERRALGPAFFSQEYECQFIATLDSVFSFEDIEAAFDNDTPPLFPVAADAPRSAGLPDLMGFIA